MKPKAITLKTAERDQRACAPKCEAPARGVGRIAQTWVCIPPSVENVRIDK
jgi:hypothetical protein